MRLRVFAALRTRGIEFWIEWISTAVLIAGVLLTSLNIYPLNLLFSFVGNLGWFVIGFLWKKWSLILVQTIILIIYFSGMLGSGLGAP